MNDEFIEKMNDEFIYFLKELTLLFFLSFKCGKTVVFFPFTVHWS